MAKRKKAVKKTHHRRRRVGAISHGGMQNELMEAAGLVGGSVLSTVVQRMAGSMNPKMVAAAQILGGLYMKNHATSPLMRGAGYGMLSAGAIHLTHDIGLIHGIEDTVSGLYSGGMRDYVDGGQHYVNGMTNNQYVSGISNNHMVSGTDNNMPEEVAMTLGMR